MMKRLLFFALSVLTFVSVLSIPCYAVSYEVSSEQIVSEPKVWNIVGIPALPAVCFSGGRDYVVILRQVSTGDLYLLCSSIPFSHVDAPDSFIDAVNFNRFYTSVLMYKSTSDTHTFERFIEYYTTFNMSGYEIVYSSFTIHAAENGSVYYKQNNDFVTVSVALAKLQTSMSGNLRFIVPVGIGILSVFITVRLIRRVLHPKIRTQPKQKFRKRRFKPKWKRSKKV